MKEWYCKQPRESQEILGGLVIRGEDFRLSRKELVSMEWSRRKEWSVGGGRGVGSMESLVKTGKWSDGEKWLEKRDEVSEEVMTKSRVWFLSWVGKLTCWDKLKEERSVRNLEERLSEALYPRTKHEVDRMTSCGLEIRHIFTTGAFGSWDPQFGGRSYGVWSQIRKSDVGFL